MTIAETAAAFRRLHEGPGRIRDAESRGTSAPLASSPGSATRRSPRRAPGSPTASAAATEHAAVTRDEALEHAAVIAGATDLPVNGDLENGFGHDPGERRRDDPRRRGGRPGRLLDRGLDVGAGRADLSARPGRRAHRGRRRGGGRAAVHVHADGARRELPARPQRSRRHDRAAPGVREGRAPTCSTRRGCATSRTSARSARRSRSPSTCSRCAGGAERRGALGGGRPPRQPRLGVLQHRARGVPARGPGRAASTGRSAASTAPRPRATSSPSSREPGASRPARVGQSRRPAPARRLQVLDAHDGGALVGRQHSRDTAPRTSPRSAGRRRSRGRRRP